MYANPASAGDRTYALLPLDVPEFGFLRDGELLIADRVDDVTLLFADVVEFTRLSSTLSPSELVGVLNEVFSAFDGLVDRYDLEKVKTIGDAYMVARGLTDGSEDHTARVADMALVVREETATPRPGAGGGRHRVAGPRSRAPRAVVHPARVNPR